MKVEMLDTVATVNSVLKKCRVYDLSPVRAKKMIDRGLAKPLETRVVQKRRTTSLPHGDKG